MKDVRDMGARTGTEDGDELVQCFNMGGGQGCEFVF